MQCVERLGGSLSKAGAVVAGLTPESKTVDVTYDPSKITLHQLAQAVMETEPVHGTPYACGVLVTVEDLQKSLSKVQSALRRIRGVNVQGLDVPKNGQPGEIVIPLQPLARQAKASDFVKASQLGEALEKAGVKFSGLPSSGAGFRQDDDSKKKPGSKGATKPKGGLDDTPAEKTKPSSPIGGTPKTKPTAVPSKAKETPDEQPRFQILGESAGKIYLVDHEAKLKKFVKAGDAFGDYLVKETGEKDGGFVVLENLETKETVRVEAEPKGKTKDEKPKDAKDTDPAAAPKKQSDPASPPAKPKDGTPDEPGRFQILGESSGKVYLVDHETKTKKFVKAGDKFGVFVVKEVGEKDGPFVVLEDPETKETIRVETERKEKPKEEKGKESKEKDGAGKDGS